jgi:hypothetical protein
MIVLPLILDLHFLDLVTSWRWVVSFMLLLLYPQYPLDRRLGGPQSLCGRCGDQKIVDLTKTQTPTLIHPACSQSLYRLHCGSISPLLHMPSWLYLLTTSFLFHSEHHVDDLSLLPVRLRLWSKQEFKDFILCSVNWNVLKTSFSMSSH